jgi:hypothetical protein
MSDFATAWTILGMLLLLWVFVELWGGPDGK